MIQSLDLFHSVAKPASVSDTELDTTMASVLYADDTLPLKRSGENYAKHLQFVRFLKAIPNEGVLFSVSREAGKASLTAYVQAAIVNGWLDESYDTKTGKRMVKRSSKMDDLIVMISEVS